MSTSRVAKAIAGLGVLALLLPVFINEWVLAYFTSDGRIDAPSQLLLLRAFDFGCIVFGIGLIAFRRTRWLPKVLASVLVTIVTVWLVDTALYLATPRLPSNVVVAMSPQAQQRYIRVNAEHLPWIYADNIRMGRPNTQMEDNGLSFQVDSLGYRNPTGYLEAAQSLDVVLVGDSFVWGTEALTMADYMREAMAPQRVYSVGMAGISVSQWRYHFEHLVSAAPYPVTPKAVVLNFYSGNDVTDTRLFTGLRAHTGTVRSADYFSYLWYQFLAPSAERRFTLPRLPEIFFLTNYALGQGGGDTTTNTASAAGPSAGAPSIPMCLKHREPAPGQIGDDVLAEIEAAVESVRALAPEAQIVLSYIPTSSGIYGDWMTACPAHQADPQYQAEHSQRLQAAANAWGISYLDVTPQLRALAQTESPWALTDHFSPAGYALYAQLLAEHIARLSP